MPAPLKPVRVTWPITHASMLDVRLTAMRESEEVGRPTRYKRSSVASQGQSAVDAIGSLMSASGAFAIHLKIESTNSIPIGFVGNITNGDATPVYTSRVVRTPTEILSVNIAYHAQIHV